MKLFKRAIIKFLTLQFAVRRGRRLFADNPKLKKSDMTTTSHLSDYEAFCSSREITSLLSEVRLPGQQTGFWGRIETIISTSAHPTSAPWPPSGLEWSLGLQGQPRVTSHYVLRHCWHLGCSWSHSCFFSCPPESHCERWLLCCAAFMIILSRVTLPQQLKCWYDTKGSNAMI